MPTFVTDEVVSATKLNNATARDWTTWTPTLTNLNVGTTGVVTARYCQLGSETVFFYFRAVLGGTGISVGAVQFTAPVTMSSNYAVQTSVGPSSYFDTSAGSTFMGFVRTQSSTNLLPVAITAASGAHNNISSTVPFTWATGDALICTGTFEVA